MIQSSNSKGNVMNQENLKKKFEELQNKAQKINESTIKLNTQIESGHEALKKVQELALKKYGTSHLEELKAMAQKWRDENEAKVSKFETETNEKEKEVNEKNNLIKQIQAN